MNAAGIHINTVAHAKGLLLRVLVLGVGDGQLATQNQMCGQPAVRVWPVVCISSFAIQAMSVNIVTQALHTEPRKSRKKT